MTNPERDKKASETSQEADKKGMFGLILAHTEAVGRAKNIIKKTKGDGNPKIHEAAMKAEEQLARIEKRSDDATKGYFASEDEGFRRKILASVTGQLDTIEKDIAGEQQKARLEKTKIECKSLALKAKDSLRLYMEGEIKGDERMAGLDEKAKRVINGALSKAIAKQVAQIDSVIKEVDNLNLATPGAKYEALQRQADEAKKQLNGEKPELKDTLAAIYEDFKTENEIQIILDTARGFNSKKFAAYVIDKFNEIRTTIERDSKLEAEDKEARLNELGKLRTEWLGDGPKTGKGRFYAELAPFARKGDVRNRAYLLASLNDKIDGIVKGKEKGRGPMEESNTNILMAALKDTPLSKAKWKLDSLQTYAGQATTLAKNWPSDAKKAKQAKESYKAFEEQAKLVYRMRVGTETDKKEEEQPMPTTGSELIAKKAPPKKELPEKPGAKKAV